MTQSLTRPLQRVQVVKGRRPSSRFRASRIVGTTRKSRTGSCVDPGSQREVVKIRKTLNHLDEKDPRRGFIIIIIKEIKKRKKNSTEVN